MGEFNEMKKDIYVPILGIIIAEFLMFYGKIFHGLGIHIINLLVIIFIIIFSSIRLEEKNVLQSLILVILLRIVNLSMPQFFTITLLQYTLIYGIMFIPIHYIIKNQHISSKELGIDFRKFYIYLPISIVIGIIMSIIEYIVINPTPLIEKIGITDIIFIGMVMFVFIGSVEEIIFRPILQTRLEKISNPSYGIFLSGGIFGIMHANYGMVGEIIVATIFGIITGYIFYKTKNLPFIISIHGTANVMLFGILPNILG